MPTRRLAVLLVLALVAAGGLAASGAGASVSSGHSTNDPFHDRKVIADHDSGKWGREVARQAARARSYLAARLKTGKRPAKLALVLDIDDTSLSTYACQKPQFTVGRLAGCVVGGKLPAIRPTLALYRYARSKGVTVVFITGRPEGLKTLTVGNLKRAGYSGRDRLVLRPAGYAKPSLVPYKSGARKALRRAGLDVVANVGDQRSDLAGGFADRAYKYPNPMYFTP